PRLGGDAGALHPGQKRVASPRTDRGPGRRGGDPPGDRRPPRGHRRSPRPPRADRGERPDAAAPAQVPPPRQRLPPPASRPPPRPRRRGRARTCSEGAEEIRDQELDIEYLCECELDRVVRDHRGTFGPSRLEWLQSELAPEGRREALASGRVELDSAASRAAPARAEEDRRPLSVSRVRSQEREPFEHPQESLGAPARSVALETLVEELPCLQCVSSVER